MASFGRYGLVHPNADKVYAASRLWFLFETESRFLAMLDELYEKATPLLNIVTPGLHLVSSLEDLTAQWTRVATLAKQNESSQVLTAQIKLLKDAVERWGLRCDWAAYSLVYTLGIAHGNRLSRQIGTALIPRWSGDQPTSAIHSGLLNPSIGGYVGTVFEETGNERPDFSRAEGGPPTSFHDVGLEGFVVPGEATYAEARALLHDWEQRREKVQEDFKNRGMVAPRKRRVGPELDEVIRWLFIRIKPPGLSWGALVAKVNAELQGRREELEHLAREYPEDSADITKTLSTVHRDYTPTAVAGHVNRLMKQLLIERAPGMKGKFG